MGLLDSLVSKAVGSAVSSALGGGRGNAGNQGLAMALIGALMKQSGGASGLFSQLQGGGLGNALASWIGKGQNQAVSGSAITQALGSDLLGNIAGQVGVKQDMASDLLAQYLPNVINNMTPNGDAQEADGFDLSDGIDMKDVTALIGKFMK